MLIIGTDEKILYSQRLTLFIGQYRRFSHNMQCFCSVLRSGKKGDYQVIIHSKLSECFEAGIVIYSRIRLEFHPFNKDFRLTP